MLHTLPATGSFGLAGLAMEVSYYASTINPSYYKNTHIVKMIKLK